MIRTERNIFKQELFTTNISTIIQKIYNANCKLSYRNCLINDNVEIVSDIQN